MNRNAAVMLVWLALAACADPDVQPDMPPAALEDPPSERSPVVAESLTVEVYYTRDEEPEPVEREISRVPGVLRSTLETLLQGPTPPERAAGLFSWFSEETAGMLRDVDLDEEGRATIDFQDFSRLISGASSAAGGRILLNELNHTIFQFDTVRLVEYRLEGSCDAFWNWLQSDCTVVERP